MNYNKTKGIAAAKEFMDSFHPDREWWIVGGMLRDTEMFAGFKDIDIFINGYASDLLPDCADIGDKNAYLLRAYTVKEYKYHGEAFEINLIFMRGDFWTLKMMTDRCDFGICQIGYEPASGHTYRSDRYMDDFFNGTLTMCRETTQERVDRMRGKFPKYEFKNPRNLTVGGAKSWSYDKESGQVLMKQEPVPPKV